MSDNLIERLRVQKTVDEMTPDELDKADFIYGHEMCVLDGPPRRTATASPR
jgi:hypothetical protein